MHARIEDDGNIVHLIELKLVEGVLIKSRE